MLVHIFADIVWVSLWIGNWLAFFSHQNLFGMAIGTETIWIPLGYNIESLSHCPSDKAKLASRMAKISTFLRVGFYSCGKRLLKRIGYESFTPLIKRGRFQLETWWVISATSTRWTIKDILFPSHKNITQVISCRLETGPATHPYLRLETLGRLSQSDNFCQSALTVSSCHTILNAYLKIFRKKISPDKWNFPLSRHWNNLYFIIIYNLTFVHRSSDDIPLLRLPTTFSNKRPNVLRASYWYPVGPKFFASDSFPADRNEISSG